MRHTALALLILAATSSFAQINDTEVWVGRLDMSGGAFRVSDLTNVSNHPGYDNQPAFLPDGKRLVFTSQIADLDDTGRAVQPTLVDLESWALTPIAGALGFSPTPTTTGGLMVLREGRVWLHEAGKEPVALTETKDAGYFTRFDARNWVLFMNDRERRIVTYDARTAKLQTMSVGANTAPHRVPGRRAVTWVAQDPFPAPEGQPAAQRRLVLRELDLDSGKVNTLTQIDFPTAGTHVWTNRGSLLMASSNTIYEWSPQKPSEWRVAAKFDNPDLQGITRIAISPTADRIALVSTPRDETIIRNSRAASNRALAERKPAAFAQLLATDAVVVSGNGQLYNGREAVQKEMEARWAATPDLVYVRTPSKVEVSRSAPSAAEQGLWTGRTMTAKGPAEWRGHYLAGWRKTITPAGTPSWTIASELFIALDCTGSGCS